MRILRISIVSSILCFTGTLASAQIQSASQLSGRRNVITTAVPFLMITPDSRSGAMADAGVAITPDANSTHWNPSKLAFVENEFGFALSYTPWLKALVPDINLSYLSGYKKIDEFQSFGGSLRYFSLGDIAFTDQFGASLGDFRPYEFAIDGTYARKLSDNFSVGVSLRFIYSNLAGNTPLTNGGETQPGTAVAGDLSAYYENETELFGYEGTLAFGGNISNIGSKITYTDETERDFIPINLRLGSYLNLELDEYNEIGFTMDLNKLLVPTSPIYKLDSNGQFIPVQGSSDFEIERGENPDQPVIAGMIQSFYDAPGDSTTSGFVEELREINPSIAIEYWYDQQFALRAGYFYEHPTKGNRQYLTLGVGLRYNVFGLDFAYLVPTNSQKTTQRSPLENTLRFTLLFNFESDSQQ
ncbi:MAG: type IX secretion system outer membrane channel protein PorV [Bacteroidia bacterium]